MDELYGEQGGLPSPKHIHEERDIAFTSDFCDNHSHPASPASLFLTSPHPRPTRPLLDVLKSLVSRPQVPTHASLCPRPSFIHSQFVTFLDDNNKLAQFKSGNYCKHHSTEMALLTVTDDLHCMKSYGWNENLNIGVDTHFKSLWQ